MATRKTRSSKTTPTTSRKRTEIPIEEDEEEQNEESEEEEEEDGGGSAVANTSGRSRAGAEEEGPTPGPSNSKKTSKKINIRSGVTMSVDEMVQNCLYYFLVNQHKKVPVKRADLIRNAMNGQKNSFNEVMAKLEQVLNDVFGMRVVGLETSKGGGFSSYIILSVFNYDLAENVTIRSQEEDSRRAVLFLLLCVIFMLNRSIDEDMIWKIITEMNLHQQVCKKKEDLRKFLKSEYVVPMYLNMEEIKDTDHVVVRYSWGLRSEREFSKHAILKFVTKQFPGKTTLDFTVQYNMVMETERELVEAEMEEVANPDGENGSALSVGDEREQHEVGFSIDSQSMEVDEETEEST